MSGPREPNDRDDRKQDQAKTPSASTPSPEILDSPRGVDESIELGKTLAESDLTYSIGSRHKDAELMQRLAETQRQMELGDAAKSGDFTKPISELSSPTPAKDYSALMEAARKRSGTAAQSEQRIPRRGSAYEGQNQRPKPDRDR